MVFFCPLLMNLYFPHVKLFLAEHHHLVTVSAYGTFQKPDY